MKKYYRRLRRKGASIYLSVTKKSEIKKTLTQLMEVRPVRIEATQRQILRNNPINLFMLHSMKILYAAFIVLLGGGGFAAVAEASQPGDALYPVKVHVNEELASAVKLSDASRAKWEVKRIERRLEESNKLQLEGKLNSDTQKQVDQLIAEHVDSVRGLVDKLKLAGDEKSLADLDKRLRGVLKDFDHTIGELELSDADLDIHESDANEANADIKNEPEQLDNEASEKAESPEKIEQEEKKEAVEEKEVENDASDMKDEAVDHEKKSNEAVSESRDEVSHDASSGNVEVGEME